MNFGSRSCKDHPGFVDRFCFFRDIKGFYHGVQETREWPYNHHYPKPKAAECMIENVYFFACLLRR